MKNQEKIDDSNLDTKEISAQEKKIPIIMYFFSFFSDYSFVWIDY